MKKLVASGIAALSIATGSLAVAAIAPFGAASAQTDSGSTTTAEATTTAPAAKPGGALTSVLAAAVADGTITQAQADAITAKLDAFRAANPGPERGARGGGDVGGKLDDVAAVIGITTDELHTKLESGATLRDVAGDKADAVAAALTERANARIDEQLAAGKIDDATATSMKAGVAAKVQAMLDGTAPTGGRGGRGPGGPGGERPTGERPAAPATSGSTTTN